MVNLGTKFKYKRTYIKRPTKYDFCRDKDFKILAIKCDLCDDRLIDCSDNFHAQTLILDEIDNSFESDLDKSTYLHGPKLILCDYCQKEYLVPSYV